MAIGQKASSIARVAGDLQKHGAMSYTTIVAATASDSAPLQYIAPYAGTALAEYFMSQGKSVRSFTTICPSMQWPTVHFSAAAPLSGP